MCSTGLSQACSRWLPSGAAILSSAVGQSRRIPLMNDWMRGIPGVHVDLPLHRSLSLAKPLCTVHDRFYMTLSADTWPGRSVVIRMPSRLCRGMMRFQHK